MHAYRHDPAGTVGYAPEAAAALAVDPDRVLKTLVTVTDGELTVAVVPASAQLDLKALARARGASRAAMADPHVAERATGYVVGGISPVGQRSAHPTVVDSSIQRFATVLVSAGRRGLDVELSPADLVRVTGATIADIARPAHG